jgi:hypothetical protein
MELIIDLLMANIISEGRLLITVKLDGMIY